MFAVLMTTALFLLSAPASTAPHPPKEPPRSPHEETKAKEGVAAPSKASTMRGPTPNEASKTPSLSDAEHMGLCDALQEASRLAGWPIAVADAGLCKTTIPFVRPKSKEEERNMEWVIGPALTAELVVEERRTQTIIRNPTLEETAWRKSVIEECQNEQLFSTLTIQTKVDGSRGWVTLTPDFSRKLASARCVLARAERADAPKFVNDSIVRMRPGRTLAGSLGTGGLGTRQGDATPRASSKSALDDKIVDDETREVIRRSLSRTFEENEKRVLLCFLRTHGGGNAGQEITISWTVANNDAKDILVRTNSFDDVVAACITRVIDTIYFEDPVLEGRQVDFDFDRPIDLDCLQGIPGIHGRDGRGCDDP